MTSIESEVLAIPFNLLHFSSLVEVEEYLYKQHHVLSHDTDSVNTSRREVFPDR